MIYIYIIGEATNDKMKCVNSQYCNILHEPLAPGGHALRLVAGSSGQSP